METLERDWLQEEQIYCPVFHTFGPGIYVRELHVPAGTFLIGHEQRFPQMNIFLAGAVTILNDDGSTGTLEAPLMFTGQPGRKKGVVLEDMVWMNVFAAESTEVCELEEHFFRKSDTWQDIEHYLDPDDHGFYTMLRDLSMTEDQMRRESENPNDQMQMPFGTYKCGVHYSPIDGKGIFATANIEQEEHIGDARVGPYRTPIGRYLNHSDDPNAALVYSGGDVHLVALQFIPGCHGGELGEEILVDYRQAFSLPRR